MGGQTHDWVGHGPVHRERSVENASVLHRTLMWFKNHICDGQVHADLRPYNINQITDQVLLGWQQPVQFISHSYICFYSMSDFTCKGRLEKGVYYFAIPSSLIEFDFAIGLGLRTTGFFLWKIWLNVSQRNTSWIFAMMWLFFVLFFYTKPCDFM